MERWIDTIPYLNRSGGIPEVFPLDKKLNRMFYHFLDRTEAENSDIVIFGAPYDGSSPANWMETSRLGPQAIRNQLARMRTYSNEIGRDIFSIIKVVDVGDIEVVFDTVEVLQRVESVATKILEDNKTPIVLGGEHMVAYGAIKAVCDRVKGNVGVIYFDAHLDLDDNLYNNSWYNGCPMRRVLDIGNVKPKNLVCIGPRGFVDFPDHQYRFAKEAGVSVFTMDDIDKEGIVSITEKAIERAKDGTDALYLSVDIDVLDPSAAPGTGMPIPGGLTNRELLKAVRLIASLGINGYDVTEATPYNDPANITALSAASVVAEMIGGMAKYRSQ